MSKRGADEYITKENGSTLNNTTESNKVKMATAAQLAKRKMAVPKSRAGRTGQSPMPGAGASSPFSSSNVFGASQNDQQSTFSNTGSALFGASQSFPPSDASNSSFNFSVPNQSSSFTFGQPTSNNPFANLNGNANHQQSGQEPPDITMESPQKKPAFGSNTFGSNNDEGTSQSTGFTFGQSTTQPPSQPNFGFGQSQGFGSGAKTSIFGQNTTTPPESSPSPNLFGQPPPSSNAASSTPPIFGQKPESSQPPSSGFIFGQTTTSSTQSSTPAFSFGQSTTSAPSTSSPAPAFSFGQPSSQPSSNGPLFGAATSNSQPAFGASAAASQPSSSTPVFGAPQTGTTNNVFSGFGSAKTAEPLLQNGSAAVSEQPKRSLFGQSLTPSSQEPPKPATADQDQPKSNPFAGLFGQSTTKQPEPTATPNSTTSKTPFSFSAPAQPSGLFSTPKTDVDDNATKQADEKPKNPLFGFGTPATQPSTNMFSSAQSTSDAASASNPFAGLPVKRPVPPEPKADKPLFGASQPNVNKNETGFKPSPSFGQTSVSKPDLDPQVSKPSGFSGFGGFGKQQSSASSPATPQPLFGNQVTESQKEQTTPSFGNMNAPNAKEQSNLPVDLFTETAKAATMSSNVAPTSEKESGAPANPKRAVNTNPPTRIPPYLNGDDYKAYDSNYRLHSLNREFQKRIASLDPSREDFENIIRNYVAARESIGESIGLYTRNVAGMKRKADEDDDRDNSDANSTKRSRQADEPQAPTFGATPASSSVFQPVPSSTSKSSNNFMNTFANKAASPPKSTASSLFSSMIPDNKSSSSATSSSNLFADLSNTNSAAKTEGSAKPSFSFGNTVGSTTPTKSPPKKPAFEVPKFAAPVGGTNFMDAFKKQSDASAAKFAKDAKEKRKLDEFDSDEDDEEEWERKYEEEERAKKAKLEQVAKSGFTPTFANGVTSSSQPSFKFGSSITPASTGSGGAPAFGFGQQNAGKSSDKPIDISDNDASGEDEDEEVTGDSQSGENEDADEEEEEADEDDLPEDEVEAGDEEEEEDDDDEEDLETVLANSRGSGKSLFDRVTPNPNLKKETSAPVPTSAANKETQPKPNAFAGLFGKGTPEAPSFSPLTPGGSKEPYVPSKTFNFTPTPPIQSPTPVLGASIFAGGAIKDGPIAGEGLFGSRPSTPSNAEKPKPNMFGSFGTPGNAGNDHTWKKGSEIKFGQSTLEAPSLSITEPSPRKEDFKPFGSLFGAGSSTANDASSKPSLGFNFGQSPVPGFLSAASHLTGGSGTTSGISSRATSPGTTDNESVATNEEDFSHDAQVSLMETRPGEENERVVFETRAKAMRFYKEDEIQGTKLTKGWNTVGVGIVRLLKNRETGKARMVLRAEPGANIILNTNIQPEVKYEYGASGNNGTVKFQVFTSEGVQGWTLKMKTHQQGQDMAKFLEENKKVNH